MPRTTPARVIIVTGWVVAVLTAAAAVIFQGAANYTVAGFSYPGQLTAVAAAVLRVLADGTGAITVGALVFAAVCTPVSSSGRIGTNGFGAVSVARRAAPLWALCSFVLCPVIGANASGQPVLSLIRTGDIVPSIGQSLPPRAWLVMACLSLVVVIGTRIVLSWTAVVGLSVLGAIALLPPAMVGNAGEGLGHDVATPAAMVHIVAAGVWLGGLVAAAAQLRRRRADHVLLRRRFGRLSLSCAAAIGVSGLAMAANLVSPSQLLSTQYGRLTLAASGLLVALIAVSVLLRRQARCGSADGQPGRTATFVAGELLLMLITFGVSVGMAQQPAARFLVTNPTAEELQVGYPLPQPPTISTLATLWRFDVLLGTAAIVLAVGYLLGVRRLRRRGIGWPIGRTVSFVAGCVTLLLTSSSGISAYAEAMFSMHMVAHMLLDMVIPILLVLGGPLSLALACTRGAPTGAATAGGHEQLQWLAGSRFVALLTNPLGSIAIFAALLFGLYLTPIFGYAVGYHWFHELMNVLFLTSGYFFFWQIIGIDPLPNRLPHLARLGMLIALMPIHAIFGVAVLVQQHILGEIFYGYLDLGWMTSQLSDQRLGAIIIWIGGELPLVVAAVLLMVRWAGQSGELPDSHSGPADDVTAVWNELNRLR